MSSIDIEFHELSWSPDSIRIIRDRNVASVGEKKYSFGWETRKKETSMKI